MNGCEEEVEIKAGFPEKIRKLNNRGVGVGDYSVLKEIKSETS